jgi:AcrR family transcriptional regulator
VPDEEPQAKRLLGRVRRTAAQTRILSAALDLFADHGVSGTSLQMIADAVGVTKAAVYHKFKTKEEVVIAVVSQ